MSDDWNVGDLAVCVATPGLARNKSVKPGLVFTVEEIEFSEDCLGLVLEGAHSRHWSKAHRASNFRKVRHDAHEACETEFVTLLKRVNQKVSA